MKSRFLLVWLILVLIIGAQLIYLSRSEDVEKGDTRMDDSNTNMPLRSSLDLLDLGPAPELTSEIWINTDQPLRLKDLRGKVILLEMWTFGCYNCRNVIPSLKEWHERYADQGLVIIGNHYPEFAYEEDTENLKQAISDLGIRYPIAQDNDGLTWQAYHNRYWPTLYLIDKRGVIRYTHIGEGHYAQTQEAILTLLAEQLD